MTSLTLPELLGPLLRVVVLLYVLGVLVVILLDNRSPQSTFAWLFLMLAFPVAGLLVYLFAGRGHKAFSNVNKFARIEIGGKLRENLRTLDTSQQAYVQKIAAEKPASYRHQLLNLVQRNSASLITAYNKVEILQNATEKYPRLMQDIRARAALDPHAVFHLDRGRIHPASQGCLDRAGQSRSESARPGRPIQFRGQQAIPG